MPTAVSVIQNHYQVGPKKEVACEFKVIHLGERRMDIKLISFFGMVLCLHF